MAGWTGLEPATSGVTGRRSNQLNYHPLKGKCEVQGTEFKVKGEVLLCTMNSELICMVGGTGIEPVTPAL